MYIFDEFKVISKRISQQLFDLCPYDKDTIY